MDETGQILLVIAAAHALAYLAVIAVWMFSGKAGGSFGQRSISKAKSLLEQQLVLEAISSCARERDAEAIVLSIGRHAAEMTGYGEWVIWLRAGRVRFAVAQSEIRGGAEADHEDISEGENRRLFNWILQNPSPLKLGRFVVGLAESEWMRSLMWKMIGGVMIPLLDGASLIGFLLLGGKKTARERRSEQFLSLFGAFAAIIIKRSMQDKVEQELRLRQQRDESFATMGRMAAGLAHEIRNPLAFIRASTEYLIGGEQSDPKKGEIAGSVFEQIDRVSQRVDALLSLGRIDPKSFTRLDLVGLVSKLAGLARERAREEGVDIELKQEAQKLAVFGDEDKLWQLLLNLVINAIEAMPQGGAVTVTSRSRGELAQVDVEDCGGGIAPELVDQVFEPYFSTKRKGTGLGLATGISIARAHGGDLELVRSGPAGTCFRVSLPLID